MTALSSTERLSAYRNLLPDAIKYWSRPRKYVHWIPRETVPSFDQIQIAASVLDAAFVTLSGMDGVVMVNLQKTYGIDLWLEFHIDGKLYKLQFMLERNGPGVGVGCAVVLQKDNSPKKAKLTKWLHNKVRTLTLYHTEDRVRAKVHGLITSRLARAVKYELMSDA